MMDINKIRSIYLIGIGGVGMSAIAQYFYAKGCAVSGYDKAHSSITDILEMKGINVFYEEDVNHIPQNVDVIIYTPAIHLDNAELNYALHSTLPVMKRSQILELITYHSFCIAVAGTHGKTTVTAMLAHILNHCGVSADAFVGGICKNINGNLYLKDDAKVVVVEADEYDRSFLNLHPNIAVVNAVDPDHLDVYGSFENMLEAYREFVDKVYVSKRFINCKYAKYFAADNTYGFCDEAKLNVRDYEYVDGKLNVSLCYNSAELKFSCMPFFGIYNIENYTAACGVALSLGVDPKDIEVAMQSFEGVKRRFDIRYNDGKRVYIDDYAHHPVEMSHFIDTVKEVYKKSKICAFFQPHLYSRTRDFMLPMAEALSKCDEVYLLDIYPARELPIPGITSSALAQHITSGICEVVRKDQVAERVKDSKADVFLTIGAGDIDKSIDTICETLRVK